MTVKRKVSELCEVTSSKRIFAADYQSEGVPFFRGKEITEKYNGSIEVGTELFIARSKFEEIKAKSGSPMPGDLLLTSVGTLGSTYVVRSGDEFYFKDGNITWFRHFKGLDSRYFHYWLTAPDGRAELKKCTIGSSQSAYTIVLLKCMDIALPGLEVQLRIASILSAYDDLIENNTRRIAILEEMARRIYEEWFVRFRFPGFEAVRMVESDLGWVPKGWRVASLGDILQNVRLATGAGEHLSARRYVPIDCIGRKTLALAEAKPWTEAQSSLVLFEEDDILFGAMRAYFHKVCIAPFAGVTRTTCFVLRPRAEEFKAFGTLTAFAKETVDYAAKHAQGATIPYAVWDGSLSRMPVVVPPDDLLRRFEQTVAPMLAWVKGAMLRQQNLRTTRDLLLPKLISGELDVSALHEPEALAA